MRSKGKAVRFAVALLALSSLLLLAASAASAAPSAGSGWVPRTSFAAGEYQAKTPQNPVATDSHGNIFSSSEESASIKVFSPDPFVGGVLLTEFATANPPRNVAVDTGDDTIYVDQSDAFGAPLIHRYTSDGQPIPTYTIDPSFELTEAAGIAVDPITHDLFVADPGAEGVRRYSATGTPLGTIPTPSMAPSYVAVAPDGSLYAASNSVDETIFPFVVTFRIVHLAGDGTLLGTIASGSALYDNTDFVKGLAWDSLDGQIVAVVGDRVKTYSPTGQLNSDSPAQSPGGIAFDSVSGLLYQGSRNTVHVYEPAPSPGVEAPLLSNLTGHSVHLKAEVEPGEAGPGEAPAESKAHFEYCPATAACGDYPASDPTDPDNPWVRLPSHDLSAPGVAVIEDDLTGLLANFDYLVRFVASNSRLTNATGAVSFATRAVAPEVVTAPATDLTETSAVLNGTIKPFGLQTTYHFEYGPTSNYGSRVPVGIEGVADGTYDTRIFSRTIKGFAPGATYHFRIVAQNSIGISFGEDRTFTTIAPGGLVNRGYEQVTPVDKRGRQLTPHFGFQANPDGGGIAYVNRGGDFDSPINSYAASRREAGSWRAGLDISLPLKVPGPIPIVSSTTMGISSDLTKALVVTNRKLGAEGNDPGLNLYLMDIATHTYTFVGSTPRDDDQALDSLTGLQRSGDNFIAGAPDFSWVLFRSPPSLLPGVADRALYRWSEDKGLQVVSELPDGTTQPVFVTNVLLSTVRWASEDGSRVYFQVGADSTVTQGPIYLRDGEGPAKAITVSHVEGDSDVPRPAQFLGASEDARYAYFMANGGALVPGAPDGGVYRYDAVTDTVEYLGASAWLDGGSSGPLGVSDDGETAYFRGLEETWVWRKGVLSKAAPSQLVGSLSVIAMSPDGRFLAYEEGGIYPNTYGDVYLYDAAADTRTCVSCLPDGSRSESSLPFPERIISNRLPRAVTDSGRLFFSTYGRLVAADANARRDVYEYHDGRSTLISPGNASFDATLADISDDGSDVFFSTAQKLVGQDSDESPDIYDARIGGGLASQNPPPPKECLRDDCKATPNPGPELPFGGSEAIRGSANVAANPRCRKGTRARKVKGKTRCVKSAKAKKKQKHTKKANTNRRQGR